MQLLSIKVIILDEYALVRAGIRSTLEKTPSIEIVGEGSAGEHLEPLVREHHPDVVLLDLMMPQWEGENVRGEANRFRPARTVKEIRQHYPGIEFIVVTHVNAPSFVFRMAYAGAKGYLLKKDDLSMELASAITTVYSGGVCLSPEISQMRSNNQPLMFEEQLSDRQIEVLQSLAFHANELQRDIAERPGYIGNNNEKTYLRNPSTHAGQDNHRRHCQRLATGNHSHRRHILPGILNSNDQHTTLIASRNGTWR